MKLHIKLFDEWIKNNYKNCWNVTGLAISIFNNNDILYKNCFGYANFKTKRKLKINDKFCIASCSKSYLCLAITLAIKAKEIPDIWSMTLGNIYGDSIHSDFKNVPIKYLASHTSGITDFNDCPKTKNQLKKYENMNGIDSRYVVSKILLNQPPHYTPGSQFKYSNIGYGILAGIVEKYIHKDYTYIINKYICNPLKLNPDYKIYYTGTGYVEGHKYDNINNKPSDPLKKNEFPNISYEEPGGEIYLKIEDSVKYLQEYLKASKGQSSIMTKSIYNFQTKPNINNYALGWGSTGNVITHTGDYYFTTTNYTIFPKESIGIVIECNSQFDVNDIIIKFNEIFLKNKY